jgi:putative phage-type endonuclease
VIPSDRFLARSSDREAWLWHRSQGVTATMVAKAATPAGFAEVVAELESPREVIPNAFMDWGNEREPHIAQVVKERYGIMPNDWLVSKGGNLSPDRWMMATPDGLSLDHTMIGEYKTSGKPLDKIPAHYMRQVQWQLYVTDAERCLFAYELRLDAPGGFAPGFDVECQWVDRDEKKIKELVSVAEKLQTINVYASWEQREELENG